MERLRNGRRKSKLCVIAAAMLEEGLERKFHRKGEICAKADERSTP